MDNEIQNINTLVWNIDPIPKPRMTQRDKWLKPPRKPVMQYRFYKDALVALSIKHKYVVKNPLSIIFVIAMPTSWSKKKRQRMANQPHESKPDLDNLIKGFKDALCENDSFVHTYDQIKKVWGERGQLIITNNDGEINNGQITLPNT
jgi:Holliday junction resolvase RusA-like endonuclease